MNEIVILCVEDEGEVREALRRDLRPFADTFRIECAEDAADAQDVLTACSARGAAIGLVLCDHVLPGRNGVELLVDMNRDADLRAARKVLVTGQAGHGDTIQAINEADLDHYIAKPWSPEDLHAVVKEQLTDFVIEAGIDVMPYVAVLDGPRLLASLRTPHSD